MNSPCYLLLDVRIVLNIDAFTDIVLEVFVRITIYYVLVKDSLDNEDGETIQFYSASSLVTVRQTQY
jgi:hypothetical protein